MKSALSVVPEVASKRSSAQANFLADRLEQGARALAELASGLSEEEWQTSTVHDGRKVGVMVHHVGNMYPLEMQLAQRIAAGEAITGVTMAEVNAINADHAQKQDGVTKAEALEFLRRNSEAAAAAIRLLTDEKLDRAVTNSFYDDAPLTTRFWLEDHPVRHSYHHLAVIRRALKK